MIKSHLKRITIWFDVYNMKSISRVQVTKTENSTLPLSHWTTKALYTFMSLIAVRNGL